QPGLLRPPGPAGVRLRGGAGSRPQRHPAGLQRRRPAPPGCAGRADHSRRRPGYRATQAGRLSGRQRGPSGDRQRLRAPSLSFLPRASPPSSPAPRHAPLATGFQVAGYDPSRPLVIDPVLSYSTYLGGSGNDFGFGMAVDPSTGDALVTGGTSSTDFPTAHAFQPSSGGGQFDAFVARLSADGSALVYSTYLGGSGYDVGNGIAVDPSTGDALVTGATPSTNFPTANAFQPSSGGGQLDAFVARLSADGSALVYSTYLGGSGVDDGWGIAVDPSTGDALV